MARVPSPVSADGVVAADVAALGREDRHAGPLADDLELGDGVRALQVGGDEDRGVALVLEPAGQLAGERRLAGALQAGEHDHGRRVLRELDAPRLHRRGCATSSSLTILTTCCAGFSASQTSAPERPLAHGVR